MKKTILATMAMMLVVALIFTGCSTENGVETTPLIIETAETNLGVDHTSYEDENATTATDTESTNATEVAIPDDDISPQNPFVGTYRNSTGETATITITDDGRLQYRELDLDTYNIQENGSILAHVTYDEDFGDVWFRLFIYPIGVSLAAWSHETNSFVETDDSRLRLFMIFTDVPDIRTNVYYKMEPLRLLNAGAHSFLPRAGYTYEYAFDGIDGGTGVVWSSRQLVRFEDIGNGEIKSTILSLTDRYGASVDLHNTWDYVYFEDATGLHRRRSDSTEAELIISYPITLGASFIGVHGMEFTFVAVNETLTTEAGIFENVVIIEDSLDRNINFYAPGFGRIRFEATRSFNELVSINR